MPIPWYPVEPSPPDQYDDDYDAVYKAVTDKGQYHINTSTTWVKPFPGRTFAEKVEDARWRLARGFIILLIVAVLILAFWRKWRNG